MRPFGEQIFGAGGAESTHHGCAHGQAFAGPQVPREAAGQSRKGPRSDTADGARFPFQPGLHSAGVDTQSGVGSPSTQLPLLVGKNGTRVLFRRWREVETGRGVVAILVPYSDCSIFEGTGSVEPRQHQAVVAEQAKLQPDGAVGLELAMLVPGECVVQLDVFDPGRAVKDLSPCF